MLDSNWVRSGPPTDENRTNRSRRISRCSRIRQNCPPFHKFKFLRIRHRVRFRCCSHGVHLQKKLSHQTSSVVTIPKNRDEFPRRIYPSNRRTQEKPAGRIVHPSPFARDFPEPSRTRRSRQSVEQAPEAASFRESVQIGHRACGESHVEDHPVLPDNTGGSGRESPSVLTREDDGSVFDNP